MPLSSHDDPFPCLAAELEQQAQLLENDWQGPKAPPPPSPQVFKPLALTPSVAQKERLASSVMIAPPQSPMIPPMPPSLCPATDGMPGTPDTSSPKVAAVLVHQVEIRPARAPTALLAAALENAKSVRTTGKSAQTGGWRGCCGDPWCNKERNHPGNCNHRASVPGLAAYPDEHLSIAGVDLRELCSAGSLNPGVSGSAINTPSASDTCQRGVPLVSSYLRHGEGHGGGNGGSANNLKDTFSDEIKSTMTGATKMKKKKDRLRMLQKARSGRPRAVSKSNKTVKKVDRSRNQPKPKKTTPGTHKKNIVWLSGVVVDPRTGDEVTDVPPGAFCTQCSALSTPVWRAGPFGHKTLCNACGVRYMKIAKTFKRQ